MTRIAQVRIALYSLAAALLAVVGIVSVLQHRDAPPPAKNATADFNRLGNGVADLALVDDDGKQLRWRELAGRPRALFFGFTHCPVICPVTVWELNNALDKIGAPADAIGIQFVTLDPARDTPEKLKAYFSGFDGRVEGYAATPDVTARIAKAYDVVYRKSGEGADYSIDHTATVFMLDSSGRVVDVVAYGAPPELMEQRLRALIGDKAKPS